MRLKHFSLLAACIVALLLAAAPLAAQDRVQGEGAKTVPPEGSKTVKGTITFIQKDTGQFLLRTDEGKEFIFTADGTTRVRNLERDSQGTGIKVADLAEGLVTSVTYLPKASQYQAVYIDALGRAMVSKQDPRPKGMAARVFVEMVNNVRRVIGVAATQNGAGVRPSSAAQKARSER